MWDVIEKGQQHKHFHTCNYNNFRCPDQHFPPDPDLTISVEHLPVLNPDLLLGFGEKNSAQEVKEWIQYSTLKSKVL